MRCLWGCSCGVLSQAAALWVCYHCQCLIVHSLCWFKNVPFSCPLSAVASLFPAKLWRPSFYGKCDFMTMGAFAFALKTFDGSAAKSKTKKLLTWLGLSNELLARDNFAPLANSVTSCWLSRRVSPLFYQINSISWKSNYSLILINNFRRIIISDEKLWCL